MRYVHFVKLLIIYNYGNQFKQTNEFSNLKL